MAGALTFKGVHHAFQGCPASGGWSHSRSTDLVHWVNLGRSADLFLENFPGHADGERRGLDRVGG